MGGGQEQCRVNEKSVQERNKERGRGVVTENKHSLVMHTHDGTADDLLHEIPSESLQQVFNNWHLLNGKFLIYYYCLPAITAAVPGSLCMSVPFIPDLRSAMNRKQLENLS